MPASDPAALAPSLTEPQTRGPLICAPEAIFDTAAIAARIDAAAQEAKDHTALRREVVAILREANSAGRAAIAEAFADAPSNVAKEEAIPTTSVTLNFLLGFFLGTIISAPG